MIAVFLDTSFLLALIRKSDQHHERARRLHKRVPGPFVTTEYVLLELADSCTAPALRGLCAKTIQAAPKNPAIQVVPASATLFEGGLQLFSERSDKTWSLTDCISIQVMQAMGLHEALTSDRHFEQAGFVALMRSAPE